ncbi:MAG: transporter, partial [Burkholderiales bacterium]|nr:transporter [Burkholderiales bacterium]
MNAPMATPKSEPESSYAWLRLGAALALMTIGGSGMYGMAVALAPVQAEFAATRGAASLPYTLTMLGFGIGGILMGRLADRFGVIVPTTIGALGLGSGFVLAGSAGSLLQFSLAHGLLIGFLGCSATFAPLVADTSLWFTRRRGIAVAICASGNYLAGAVWPPVLQYFFDTIGWRATYIGTGIFCTASILALSLLLRRRPPALEETSQSRVTVKDGMPLGLTPNALMTLLIVAGVACCVAMSMPQVHIVAYCGDLGYGAARGAEMLSLMLGFGIGGILMGRLADRFGV